MQHIRDIEQQLRLAASLLDSAAMQIRDAGIDPVQANIRHIAAALSEISEVRHAICAIHPELAPPFLKEPSSEVNEANRRLTETLGEALRLLDSSDDQKAIEMLESYVESESSELHVRIARDQISMFKKQ